VMYTLQPFRQSWAIDEHFDHLAVTTLSLSLLVNYPHFLESYKLAYTRGRGFVLGHWWQLIAVPVALVALFAAAWVWYDVPVERIGVLARAMEGMQGWGANVQLISGPRVGDLLFTAAFNLMILTLGWHYTKQVYGCMMVYAHYDGYPIAPHQRTLLRWALLSVWVMVFVDYNLAGDFRAFRGFSYSTLDLPDIAGPVTQLIVLAGLAAVVYFVFYQNYRVADRRPSLTLLAPFVAIYLWWMPETRQQEYFLLMVPLFHGLQYLAFAYRMESTRLRSAPNREARATVLILGLVLAGWLAFEFVPDLLDTEFDTFGAWRTFFFFTAAFLFINIHHYFIDNALWRFRDPQVRAYLLD